MKKKFCTSISKTVLFILLNIYITSATHERTDYTDKGYEELLQWGYNHSLKISKDIKLTLYNKEKQYISTKNIPKGEIIMDIPLELTLTIDKAFKLFNSSKLKSQYQKYKSEYSKSISTFADTSQMQQSFLAYLLYSSNQTGQADEGAKKFYEYYKPLYYIFEDDLSHIPSFYSVEQINTFLNTTYFGSFFEIMNVNMMRELNLFEKKIFYENITINTYFHYRFLVVQKSYNISNTMTITPFIDFIKRNSEEQNCILMLKNGHIIIKAISDIKEGDPITLKAHKISNHYSLFFYGKINEEIEDYIPSFIIPIIIPNLFEEEGISLDIDEKGDENQMDLAWPDYYEVILPTYKEVALALKKDDSDYSCYGFILKYLKRIFETYKNVDYEDIDDEFFDEYDSDNIIKIIESEKEFLKKKIEELNNIMEKMKNEKAGDNEDL